MRALHNRSAAIFVVLFASVCVAQRAQGELVLHLFGVPGENVIQFEASGTNIPTQPGGTDDILFFGGDFLVNPTFRIRSVFNFSSHPVLTNHTNGQSTDFAALHLDGEFTDGEVDDARLAWTFGNPAPTPVAWAFGHVLTLSGSGTIDLSAANGTIADFKPGSYLSTAGNGTLGDVRLNITSVPEPGSALGCGIAAVAVWRTRRRRKTETTLP